MTIVQCTVQMYIPDKMCNVDSHGGMDKNGNTAPPAPEEFFLLLLLLLPYISWGRLEGFSGGVKDTPAIPRRRIYPLSRPPARVSH